LAAFVMFGLSRWDSLSWVVACDQGRPGHPSFSRLAAKVVETRRTRDHVTEKRQRFMQSGQYEARRHALSVASGRTSSVASSARVTGLT
jgi:hypothetical protein